MGRCSFPRAVSVPARGAGEASETGREQRLAQPRATDHFDRHGVIRGIQRGTAARNASYSFPNVCSSVGSSYATTATWKTSHHSAPYLNHLARPPPSYGSGGKMPVRRCEYGGWAGQFRVQRPAMNIDAAVEDVLKDLR